MTLLEDFLSGLSFPPVTLLKRYLEGGIPEDLHPSTHCTPTDWCLKSSSKSSELRDRGNEACRSKQYDEALKYYSQSIATAPTDSQELAFAYGNRSAILQVQKEYELCLLDTNRALDGPLPESSKLVLLERKANSWCKLQEQNLNRRQLRAGLANLKRSSQERDNLIACVRQWCYISKVDMDDTDLVIDRSFVDDPAWETKFENTICENLSPKVHQRVDNARGQVFIAADDIEPGEILSNDDFYALILKERNQQEYCNYCSVWCKALIPCVSCSQDMYCSVGCREEAYDTYHETECKILPLWGNVRPSKRQGRRLYLRTFLTGTKQGSDLSNLLNDPQVYAALNGNLDHGNAQYSSRDYIAILNRFWKLETAKCRNRIKEVLEMFAGLRHLRFFGTDVEIKIKCEGNILTGEELLATVLLAHNFSLNVPRCHYTTAFFWEPQGTDALVRPHGIGAAVGPWHSFLTHSCCPNVISLISRRQILIRSLRPIKAGEQICLSMGSLIYTTQTRVVRQVMLKRLLGRECGCVACVESWRNADEWAMFQDEYLTSNESVIENIDRMKRWMIMKLNWSIAEEDLKIVLRFCKTVRQFVKESSYTVLVCETFLRFALGPWGNLYFSQNYIASLYDSL